MHSVISYLGIYPLKIFAKVRHDACNACIRPFIEKKETE
jgi:hypothetical protein